MVISSQPLVELVPLEKARMPGRVVCQWDKDSVDDARMVKVDFLALGMLSLVDYCLAEIATHHQTEVDLSRIDFDDPAVYDMICDGDTIGLFQIESRAQGQTIPRTRPRSLDDLTVQVAIIRPGPIVGGAVSPYVLRRQKKQAVAYDAPCLAPILEETLGVILYQEQVLQVPMVMAGFTAGQADQMRRAMSRKRSHDAMAALRQDFYDGARAKGYDETTIKRVFDKLMGFAEFGFPKSHAAAFALLAYQSAWLKKYYPVEFICSLLNAQPMGFYSSDVIVADARRRGVRVLPPHINRSRWRCTVERAAGGSGLVVRLGFMYVATVGEKGGREIERLHGEGGPFRSLFDFVERTQLKQAAIERLITCGAFDEFGLPQRELLWQLGLIYRSEGRNGVQRQAALPLPVEQDMIKLPRLSLWQHMANDYAVLGLSPTYHPMAFLRRRLRGHIIPIAQLETLEDGQWMDVAGLVVCRQRPSTAAGFLFLVLEDETGLANVVVRPKVYERFRAFARAEPFLIIHGPLQRRDGVVNVVATSLKPLHVLVPKDLFVPEGHNFH
jgi:error-prone DNA polymerase